MSARAVLGMVIAMVVGVPLTGELLVRWMDPPPRLQVVRAGEGPTGTIVLEDVDGVPVWHRERDLARRHEGCLGRTDRLVAIFGSSILAGVGIEEPVLYSTLLEQRLDETCVANFAQPAMTGQGQLAIAGRFVPEHAPDVVLFEIWRATPFDYRRVGDAAYQFDVLERDAAGLPNPFGVPVGLNEGLFSTSSLYEYATLALAAPAFRSPPAAWKITVEERLPVLLEQVKAAGGALVLVLCPPLDAPFAEQIRRRAEGTHPVLALYDPVVAFAEANGVPYIRLEEALVDQDLERIRKDPCCHYSEAAQPALADALEPLVRAALTDPSRPDGTGAAPAIPAPAR